ncbi:MAG: hypothetical protein QF752_10775 [Planctomycetota bacterium]|jgi:hypothetical protein|nr:hypothetical protein [Planctomycetota bacterium]
MTSSFPYNDIQPHQHWKSAVSGLSPGRVDPQIAGRFRISRTTRVASAGSCFARRIADGLRTFGFNYLVT